MNSGEKAAKIIDLIKGYEKGELDQERVAVEIGEYAKRYGTPIISGNTVIFVYVGFATKVSVIGDWNGWDPNADPMERIGITPVFYLIKEFPLDARLEYKLIVDKKRILDPLNPLKSEDGVNSEIRMPAYKPPEFISSNIVEVYGIRGKLKDFSSFLETRRVQVYTPPGYEYSSTKYPLLVVNDGTSYLTRAKLTILLDYAILKGEIAPILAVLVDAQAKREYALDEKYAEFVAFEVIPLIFSNYRVDKDKVCILGASLGGLASLFIGISHPRIFKFIISQSGLFFKKHEFTRLGFNVKKDIFDFLEEPRESMNKIFLEWGVYEHILGVNITKRNEELYRELLRKRFETHKLVVNQGHNWTNWRDSLLFALKFFFRLR